MHGEADNDLPSEDTVHSTFVVETESDSGSSNLPSWDDTDANPDGHGKLARTSWSCACNCLRDSDLRARAETLRATLKAMSREARKRYVWMELRKMCSDAKPRQQSRVYLLFGLKVCRRSWCRAMVIGGQTLNNFHKSIAEGMLGPPEDARKGQCLPRCRDDKSKDVDQFFYWCWSEVAQNLPSEPGCGVSLDSDESDDGCPGNWQGLPLWMWAAWARGSCTRGG